MCSGDPWSPSDMDVVAGAHDLRRTEPQQQRSNINRWIIHSGFNAKTQDSDIALLELWPPVKISSAVKVVSLPSSDAPDGTMCKVLGWGHNGLEPFNRKCECVPVRVHALAYVWPSPACTICIYGYGLSTCPVFQL